MEWDWPSLPPNKIMIGMGSATTSFQQYNCEWRGENNMIHMKDLQLVVEAPYKPENCTGNDAPALEHLKKVLAGMRSKLNMA